MVGALCRSVRLHRRKTTAVAEVTVLRLIRASVTLQTDDSDTGAGHVPLVDQGGGERFKVPGHSQRPRVDAVAACDRSREVGGHGLRLLVVTADEYVLVVENSASLQRFTAGR